MFRLIRHVAALAWLPLVAAAGSVAAGDLPPPVSDGPAGAGRRVRVTPPEHVGTAVHHTLFLPADWSAARRDAAPGGGLSRRADS